VKCEDPKVIRRYFNLYQQIVREVWYYVVTVFMFHGGLLRSLLHSENLAKLRRELERFEVH
jgi:hypothetical protein